MKAAFWRGYLIEIGRGKVNVSISIWSLNPAQYRLRYVYIIQCWSSGGKLQCILLHRYARNPKSWNPKSWNLKSQISDFGIQISDFSKFVIGFTGFTKRGRIWCQQFGESWPWAQGWDPPLLACERSSRAITATLNVKGHASANRIERVLSHGRRHQSYPHMSALHSNIFGPFASHTGGYHLNSNIVWYIRNEGNIHTAILY